MKSFNENDKQKTWVAGVTQFFDLTQEEFLAKISGVVGDVPAACTGSTPQPNMRKKDNPLPSSYDARDHNLVASVKNQGSCGSCWAFSATGAVEGQLAKATGKITDLSEQQTVDCDKVDKGCQGGLMHTA